jgi:predicted nucleotide-binding protein
MVLSEVEREITKSVVQRFLHENKPSSRKFLVHTFKSSRAFYRLTDSNILANITPNAATVDQVYLPRALAFYYCADPDALKMARESVTVVIHALQNLFDSEPDKTEFTSEDLTAAANNIVEPRPEPEVLKLGLYLVRDLGVLSSFSSDATQSAPFRIAEHIVEIRDVSKVWDDFIAHSAPRDVSPQRAASELDRHDSDILIASEGLDNMARTPRDTSSVPHHPTISPELALHRLQKYIDQIPEIRQSGHGSPAFSTWKGNVKIVLGEFYGENSLVFRQFNEISFSPAIFYDNQPDHEFVKRFNNGLEKASGFLESRIIDLSERVEREKNERSPSSSSVAQSDSRKIFVVHGHDHGHKEAVARFLGQLGLDPIILHEQADRGKTVIEKFEAHAGNVRAAVVILTADDVAYPKSDPDTKEFRARQNVILELGYFVGKLGRAHSFALVEKDVTLPSDIHGVVYIPLDEGHWRLRFVKELKAAGLDVDANRAF